MVSKKISTLGLGWERKAAIFEDSVDMGFIMIWLDKILMG